MTPSKSRCSQSEGCTFWVMVHDWIGLDWMSLHAQYAEASAHGSSFQLQPKMSLSDILGEKQCMGASLCLTQLHRRFPNWRCHLFRCSLTVVLLAVDFDGGECISIIMLQLDHDAIWCLTLRKPRTSPMDDDVHTSNPYPMIFYGLD